MNTNNPKPIAAVLRDLPDGTRIVSVPHPNTGEPVPSDSVTAHLTACGSVLSVSVTIEADDAMRLLRHAVRIGVLDREPTREEIDTAMRRMAESLHLAHDAALQHVERMLAVALAPKDRDAREASIREGLVQTLLAQLSDIRDVQSADIERIAAAVAAVDLEEVATPDAIETFASGLGIHAEDADPIRSANNRLRDDLNDRGADPAAVAAAMRELRDLLAPHEEEIKSGLRSDDEEQIANATAILARSLDAVMTQHLPAMFPDRFA
jgi:hypothetical protein